MTTVTPKAKVPARLVERMVKFYGSIDAARLAYKAARAEARSCRRGAMVLWVSGLGRIVPSSPSEVFYTGSVDAFDVIPS